MPKNKRNKAQAKQTDQKKNWKVEKIFQSFDEAKSLYRQLKDEGQDVKIHLMSNGFNVKIGTPSAKKETKNEDPTVS